MRSMTADEARQFAARWLPAWTGNNPPKLASFYTEDLFYLDPTVPDGLTGKQAFVVYVSKLLANNPDWVWTHESAIPLQDGFLRGDADRAGHEVERSDLQAPQIRRSSLQ